LLWQLLNWWLLCLTLLWRLRRYLLWWLLLEIALWRLLSLLGRPL
jgi:hypothetical protein